MSVTVELVGLMELIAPVAVPVESKLIQPLQPVPCPPENAACAVLIVMLPAVVVPAFVFIAPRAIPCPLVAPASIVTFPPRAAPFPEELIEVAPELGFKRT